MSRFVARLLLLPENSPPVAASSSSQFRSRHFSPRKKKPRGWQEEKSRRASFALNQIILSLKAFFRNCHDFPFLRRRDESELLVERKSEWSSIKRSKQYVYIKFVCRDWNPSGYFPFPPFFFFWTEKEIIFCWLDFLFDALWVLLLLLDNKFWALLWEVFWEERMRGGGGRGGNEEAFSVGLGLGGKFHGLLRGSLCCFYLNWQEKANFWGEMNGVDFCGSLSWEGKVDLDYDLNEL